MYLSSTRCTCGLDSHCRTKYHVPPATRDVASVVVSRIVLAGVSEFISTFLSNLWRQAVCCERDQGRTLKRLFDPSAYFFPSDN